jgi:hypothetical protein
LRDEYGDYTNVRYWPVGDTQIHQVVVIRATASGQIADTRNYLVYTDRVQYVFKFGGAFAP